MLPPGLLSLDHLAKHTHKTHLILITSHTVIKMAGEGSGRVGDREEGLYREGMRGTRVWGL